MENRHGVGLLLVFVLFCFVLDRFIISNDEYMQIPCIKVCGIQDHLCFFPLPHLGKKFKSIFLKGL